MDRVYLSGPYSDTVKSTPTAPPMANIKAQYRAGSTQASTNGIQPVLKLVNTGSTSIPLSEITVRYWFTNDGSAAVNYWCDWAQVGVANLTGTVKTVSPARPNADRYLEVAFNASAGSIAAGGTSGEIQNRVSKSDWTNFTQTNDASFDATKTAFADWNKVTVYRNGVLVWGCRALIEHDRRPVFRSIFSVQRPRDQPRLVSGPFPFQEPKRFSATVRQWCGVTRCSARYSCSVWPGVGTNRQRWSNTPSVSRSMRVL